MPASKPFVFVLMPFAESFRDIYLFGIKQTCEQLGCYCERVDEQIYHESILSRIYNQIAKADILIADMSDRNPNVFYEVGYAHGLGKKVILLTQKSEDIPFDFKHFPHIIYEGHISQLQPELSRHVRWLVENPEKKDELLVTPLEVFLGKNRVTDGMTLAIPHKEKGEGNHRWKFELSIVNSAEMIARRQLCRISFEMPSWTERIYTDDPEYAVSEIDLPSGRKLFQLEAEFDLLPGAFQTFLFGSWITFPHASPTDEMIIRILLESGPIVFRISLFLS